MQISLKIQQCRNSTYIAVCQIVSMFAPAHQEKSGLVIDARMKC